MDKTILTSFLINKMPKTFFPVIPIRFHFSTTTVDSTALIDSGATISVFRADVALNLGLDLENGKEIYLGGVGGHIKGYIHKLKIEIGEENFFAPLFFLANIWFLLICWGEKPFSSNSELSLKKRKAS